MTTDQLLRELAADVREMDATLTRHVDSLIVDWLAGTQTLAARSRDPDGRTCCCVCGTGTTQLTLIAPGWGGVWVCAVCDEETR